MEINELRYFLSVAKTENIHRASESIGISPGSLSKAISKLEIELKVNLFKREGRNIKLTEHGRHFKRRTSELLAMEESIRTDMLGAKSSFQVAMGGSEILLSHFGVQLSGDIKDRFPRSVIELQPTSDSLLFSNIRDGDIQLGLTTFDVPAEFDSKLLGTIEFLTCIGKQHPLYRKRKTVISVEEVLEYEFVVPRSNILGKIAKSDSTDGWRDDKFPRKIGYVASGLKSLESLVTSGKAIAYLPNYFLDAQNLTQLNISGCPYHCRQKVRMITRDRQETGWLNQLF